MDELLEEDYAVAGFLPGWARPRRKSTSTEEMAGSAVAEGARLSAKWNL